MTKIEQIVAARKLVEFVRAYTVLQEKQLNAIRSSMEKLAENVMGTIGEINSKTLQKSSEADVVLITAGERSPGRLATDSADQVVFQKISGKSLDEYEATKVVQIDSSGSANEENRIRRLAGRFTKHMEALSTLETDLGDLMVRMMGALSGDDVIRQWLEHVMHGVESLSSVLSGVVASADSTLTERGVEEIKARLLTDLYRSYHSEEEKEIFHSVFGRPVGVRKVS